MFRSNIISSVKRINYHDYVLLTILVVLISDKAEACRGGRIIGRKSFQSILHAVFLNIIFKKYFLIFRKYLFWN